MMEIKVKPMRRLTVTIPEEYVAGLEDMAEDMGASVSEAVREAVASYLMENYWRETIGGAARTAILAGASNDDALLAVRQKFPNASTSLASIAWYRSKLRREFGEKVPTDRQARAPK
jgi:metal-responsive CopG/Arc/MetJ family transcriptional regulator